MMRTLFVALLLGLCAGATPALAGGADAFGEAGGDLASTGKELSPLLEAAKKIGEAAPQALNELAAALDRVAAPTWRRGFGEQLGLVALTLAIGVALVLLLRWITRRQRLAFAADPVQARGAAGELAFGVADRLLVVGVAYLGFEIWFKSGDLYDALAIALLWGASRWWFGVLVLELLLRPSMPAFRLIAMDDATARRLKAILSIVTLFGMGVVSIVPVLVRAGLPVATAQLIGLLEGLIVAAGCALALRAYRASSATPPRSRLIWTVILATLLALAWLTWSYSLLLLDFSPFDSLEWSFRIASYAYIVHSLLGLSANHGRWVLVQRSLTAAAVLGIAFLLAQTWLVKELHIVSPESWAAGRRSLITAAVTLFVGYVAWRSLHHWTEERLKAANAGIGPDSEDTGSAPASRLTTILPLLRIFAGIAILFIAVLLALTQLGIQITPLLAGAGVFGLAISFGSQALVRDIVAGIFFMADDAFRVGEYLDTGRLKGTVERISLRSVRLRHQNGQVHTIPYGQLTSITNFSRDWQTVKFNLRLARNTDIEVVRKAVKKLGQEMMKDPELGKELLQPLKLQGMSEIADNAMVVRLKFTVRPLKPSWVQRESLKRIHKMFREKGIEFASNAIMVQTAGGMPVPAELAGGAVAGSAGAPPPHGQNPAG